ncbi:DALR anticodon-binding domain-containing protein 3-like [Diachasmimorpha longicaudata]|uniref:DALR anticodon-binding domain-containing protein 3-like n=1 Tax=Diachasmimorpha longicaudata TaxID=58733 RepID=UPI0030B88BC2
MIFGITKTINDILYEITGKIDNKTKIIRINTDDTWTNGDLWFPSNLLAWRGLIIPDNDNKPKDILELYTKRKKIDISGLSNESITQKAIGALIAASTDWEFKLERGCLDRGRVCLFLNRPLAIGKIIRDTIKHPIRLIQENKTIFFCINADPTSRLTTFRLEKLKSVIENIFKLQGYEITDTSLEKYLLTTKSQGPIDDGYRKYVCGVVKNPKTNAKEVLETKDSYMQRKMKILEELNEGRESEALNHNEVKLRRVAEAILTFEMLGVRPSRASFIEISRNPEQSIASSKGGSFVLYNVARIEAIFQKFEKQYRIEKWEGMEDVDRVDFGQLLSQEEWELAYNFVLAYPQVLRNSVLHGDGLELCPQLLCTFLSHFSQKFSIYYRRTRILTEDREHLIPIMTARLWLLKAILIVLRHALEVLDITPIRQM